MPKDVVFYINSKEKSQLLKDFKKRAEKGCFVSEGKIFDIDGLKSELKRRNMFFKSADSEHANEVAGKSAFPGKAKGKARIIKTKKDLDKVKGGDIIVASMTNPDFTLHLKKSGAFVTDEGGLMCHAAIIAREMKKPCIVGTKTATEILKDGDLVEVDADKGVVKILKRAE